jgi:hypothetical protein
MKSMPPPAACGTTSLTGLAGNTSAASAARLWSTPQPPSTSTPAQPRKPITEVMIVLTSNDTPNIKSLDSPTRQKR